MEGKAPWSSARCARLNLVGRVLHSGVAVALLVAFLQSPFIHAHRDTAGHIHWDDLLHLHSRSSSAEDVGLEAPDHCSDACFRDWVTIKAEVRVQWFDDHSIPIPFPSLDSRTLPLVRHAPQIHDPPWRLNLAPRAPPA